MDENTKELETLNDLQKLLGDINWLRPYLGIPTYELSNLFSLLRGDSKLNSPRSLTAEAEEELKKIEKEIVQIELKIQKQSIDKSVNQ